MVNKSTATIEGLPLLASGSVSWSLRSGTGPVIGSFDMIPQDANSLFQNGARKSPVTLKITPPNGNPVEVKNLWILNIAPGSNPFIASVTLADRRWFWSYAHTLRRFNMRRRVGNKLAKASDLAPTQLNQSIPNFDYWPWSLNSSAAWGAQDALRDMMTNSLDGVLQKEKQYWGTMAPLTIDSRISNQANSLPIEDLQLDDQGDAATMRLLKYLPEAEITVDYDGTVVVFSRIGGDEQNLYNAITPEIPGGGHAAMVSNAALRPSKVNVFFTPEVEVRFDFTENQNAVASAPQPAPGATVTGNTSGQIIVNYKRQMDNVLPSVDYQLGVNGNTIPMGTYILMDDAFLSWGNLPVVLSGGGSVKLDHPLVQKSLVPYLDLWSKLNKIGQQPGPNGNAGTAPWIERIAAVKNHYRTSFRITSAWRNQMFSMRAYRVATIDPQSGMRGPSLPFGDYCLIYSQRSQARNANSGAVYDWAQNRSGYPKNGILDNTVEPSPGYITILDEDQGIIHVDYRIDYNRMIEMILPSMLQTINQAMPTTNITDRTRAITFDTLNKAGGYASLSPSFKLATILTCVPASPNNLNQLYKVSVTPQDVQNSLPAGTSAGITNANGPEMDIHCGLDTARVMWVDSRSSDIEAIFGVQNGQVSSTPLTPNLSGLVINGDAGSLTSGASLVNLARAEASKLYASLVDHLEGTVTGGMNGNVHLNGMTTEIRHTLEPNGMTTTQLTLPSTAERMSKQLDVFRFLNSTSRAVILKLVQPQGGA